MISERDNARVKAWVAAHPERSRAIKKAWRERNPDAWKKEPARSAPRILSDEQKAAAIARAAAWRKANPEKYAELSYLRKRRMLQAQPAWVDKEALRDVYLEARYFQMHVDHIIPLKGKNVSGLHVPTNLQLLYPEENRKKGTHHAD